MTLLLGVTILLSSVWMPLALYVGYLFGKKKQRRKAITFLIVYSALSVIDASIFWCLIYRW